MIPILLLSSLGLFSTICTGCTDSQKLMATFSLSKRQYYDRMNDLRNSSLVRRRRRKYDTTSFGQIINNIVQITEKIITERHWKLQAFDMMNLPANGNSLGEDNMKILDILLDNTELKEILLRKKFSSSASKEPYGHTKSKRLIQPIH
jgi:hypothetical protein